MRIRCKCHFFSCLDTCKPFTREGLSSLIPRCECGLPGLLVEFGRTPGIMASLPSPNPATLPASPNPEICWKVTAVWVMVAMYTDIATEGTRGVSSGLETLGAGADSFTCTCLMISTYHSLRSATKPLNHWLALPLSHWPGIQNQYYIFSACQVYLCCLIYTACFSQVTALHE